MVATGDVSDRDRDRERERDRERSGPVLWTVRRPVPTAMALHDAGYDSDATRALLSAAARDPSAPFQSLR